MQGIAEQNDEIIQLITIIDVISKYALAVPLYAIDATTIKAAIGQMITAAKTPPTRTFRARQKHLVY